MVGFHPLPFFSTLQKRRGYIVTYALLWQSIMVKGLANVPNQSLQAWMTLESVTQLACVLQAAPAGAGGWQRQQDDRPFCSASGS